MAAAIDNTINDGSADEAKEAQKEIKV